MAVPDKECRMRVSINPRLLLRLFEALGGGSGKKDPGVILSFYGDGADQLGCIKVNLDENTENYGLLMPRKIATEEKP